MPGVVHRHDEHADAGMRRLGLRVGPRGKEHVFSPPGRRPDLLPVDDPLIAVAYRAGAQRREIGARLRLAVAHAVHGFAAQDLGQVFPLLLRRAEHHQRIGLDRGTDPRRFAPLHGFHEGDLLQRRARLPAELLRPSQADPAGLADIPRKFRIELPLRRTALRRMRLCVRRTSFARASAAPVRATRCRRRRDHIAAVRAPPSIEQKRGDATPRIRGAAQRDRIEMHALEMARRLVFLGIADRPERMLGFERDAAATRRRRRRRPHRRNSANSGIAAIMQMGGVIERQPHAFERDQAIGELVLDRLEFADRLPELLPLLGIVDRQIERAPRRAIRPRNQRQLCLRARDRRAATASSSMTSRRRGDQPEPRYRPQAPIARVGSQLDAGRAQFDEREDCLVERSHEKVRAATRDLDKAKQPARLSVRRSGSSQRCGRDRAPRTKTRRAPAPACSFSSKSTAASARRTGQGQIGESGRPHRRRTRGPAKFGHHHQDLAKSAFARDRSRAQATPCPTSLRPDRRNRPPAKTIASPPRRRSNARPRNPRRESRSISLTVIASGARL